MLESLTIQNFKSYQEATLPLRPLTFLIGPNASGKSNALEAFLILHWLAKGARIDDLDRLINSENNIINVRGRSADLFNAAGALSIGCRWDDDNTQYDFNIKFAFNAGKLAINDEYMHSLDREQCLYKIIGRQSGATGLFDVTYNNFEPGMEQPHIQCIDTLAVFWQLGTPAAFHDGDTVSRKLIPQVVNGFREQCNKILFLNPQPSSMRSYAYIGDNELRENGSNLSSVLLFICQNEEYKRILLDFVRFLPEQDITDIDFLTTERREVMVRLCETFGKEKREMEAPLLSDGTLRVLAVAAALFSVPEQSLVIVEEIDNGIHPSRAADLVEQIQNIAEKRRLRVLATSHNPALLDAVPDAALGDVLYCYRNPDCGDSRIVRLADMERFPELTAQGSLGQLLTRRILERFVKDPTTAEERREAALAWLDAFARESA